MQVAADITNKTTEIASATHAERVDTKGATAGPCP